MDRHCDFANEFVGVDAQPVWIALVIDKFLLVEVHQSDFLVSLVGTTAATERNKKMTKSS